MEYSLVIPLWNEAANIQQLVEMLHASKLHDQGMREVVLVNNGSSDKTGFLINDSSKKYSWIKTIHLSKNENYGGGVYEGFQRCCCDYVAYIPGDLQVHADDLNKIWHNLKKYLENQPDTLHIIVKGRRTVRMDGLQTRCVSFVYTFLANMILGVKVADVNGLPKMFHKDLLQFLPQERMKTFVFDVQLLLTARKQGWPILEIPVTFHARRIGVSSWSKKKFKTYWTVLKQILKLRTLNYSGVKGS